MRLSPRTLLSVTLLLPVLAACAAPTEDQAGFQLPGFFGPQEPEVPPGPPPLPLAVQEALPPGVPQSVVLQDAAGCYLYSIERTDPPSGYPVRDAAGNPICDDGTGPIATVAGLPGPAAATPVPLAAESAAAGGIDITPVLTAPLPEAGAGAGASPPARPATVPGDITPPAPLAPLN